MDTTNFSQPIQFLLDKYGPNYEGHISLFCKQTKTTRFYDFAHLDDLDTFIESEKGKMDLYAGLSLQRESLPLDQRGSTESVLVVPGFFADIDFAAAKSSGKNYPADEAEALAIMSSFICQPSSVVRTGNGLHVHYDFNEAYVVESEESRAFIADQSRAFQRLLGSHFRRHGRSIDSVGDLVRNFRLPGTFNHKAAESKPVEILLTGGPRLKLSEHRSAIAKFSDVDSEWTAKYKRGKTFAPASHEKIMEGCEWYREVVVEGSATCAEPDWYAGSSITARCADGPEIFHAYSARHSAYNQREAEEKLKRAIDEAGPRTCAVVTYDLGHEAICSRCPNRDVVGSPVSLGIPIASAYDPGSVGPIPLGYDGSELILRNQQTGQAVRRSAMQLATPAGLMELAPKSFWVSQFPRLGQKGVPLGIHAENACDALIQTCRKAGYRKAAHIRGLGVWREGDKIIANLGGEDIKSDRFIYSTPPERLALAETDVPTAAILEFFSKPSWATPSAPELLLGAAFVSVVCGALTWRPHVSITGPAGSGKSTILDGFAEIVSPFGIVLEGTSSEAGVRQMIGHDARPVILDEFEPEGGRDASRLARIVKLMRSSSSGTGEVARGTPDGKAHVFAVRSMFIVGAINPPRASAADAQRLIRLEMRPQESARASRGEMLALRAALQGTGPAFCKLAIDHVQNILESIAPIHKALDVTQERQADNIATLLAGYWAFVHRRTITENEAAELATKHQPAVEAHKYTGELDDATECLNVLLGYAISAGSGRDLVGVGHVLAQLNDPQRMRDNNVDELRGQLAVLGIKLENQSFIVSNTHPGLEAVYKGTRWEGKGWGSALARLDGAEATPLRRFHDGVRSRAVLIPFLHVADPDELAPKNALPSF